MPKVAKKSRIGMSRVVLRALLGAAPFGLLCMSTHANAQIAGTTARPLPNVMLLVDTSGSMERMPDNSLPATNRKPGGGTLLAPATLNQCDPGVGSNPNRWGMLLQALTGNMQPYYSCRALDRSKPEFKNEFQINAKPVYDGDYYLPYHRPLSGATAATACTFAPSYLPGAADGNGVGPAKLGSGGKPAGLGKYAADFPPDAFTQVYDSYLFNQYKSGFSLTAGTNECVFEQANDGQLDAARDYIRFGLMTFDNDTNQGTGVVAAAPAFPSATSTVDTSNPFLGQWSYAETSTVKQSSTPSTLGFGLPAGCAPPSTAFEVGARHLAAPPWEGRMVPFAPWNSDLYDIETTNDQIQKVLLGTRPYGATPIDGMLEDARDYILFNTAGPNQTDQYVKNGCRDEYIILLTDGAPNLDLRPSCEGAGGACPFNKAAVIADELARGVNGGIPVRTFVIGFSVNGAGDGNYTNDGFPTAPLYKDCKSWYNGPAPFGGGGNPTTMLATCTAPATKPQVGSTAEACCKLDEIAFNGNPAPDRVGPFFAETQADLVLSFGRILGGVSKAATTRTLPGYAPAVTLAGINNTASFVASFIPNARKVWSGEIDRTRSVCVGSVPTPQLPQSVAQGDSYSANLAAQTIANNRLFISVTAQTTSAAPGPGNVVDSARTIRPNVAGTPDGIPTFTGTEVAAFQDGLKSASNWAEAMDILPNNPSTLTSPTCKRSRGVPSDNSRATIEIPALTQAQCRDIMWGFATATSGLMTPNGTWDFNARCSRPGNLAVGFCSISNKGCNLDDPNACSAASGGVAGEVCVPNCSALGAIYHSSPVIVGAPNQFLRDDFYQAFAAAHASRRPTLYVASADGVLHAFKALANNSFDTGNYEMWAFVPPAVLPKIATNYPTGQQILLDGTPVVKDTVWDRKPTDVPTVPPPIDRKAEFHTTLVAGMGQGGAGYYALNVTDPDCGGFAANTLSCTGAGKYTASVKTVGPHFLWQLTDIEWISGDKAKLSRIARDGTKLVSLFGREGGTPAITTLQVDPGDGGGARQIGVAILPGGIDGPPIKGGQCKRALDSGGYNPVDYDFSDPGYGRRTYARQWAADCVADPVPGRGVTIVRLDTGEVLRHFGRMTGSIPQDAPLRLAGKTTPAPFDSPMIGTPVVYPNIVGATGQKIFIGDADGAIWRIDVSLSNPALWKAALFQDLVNVNLSPVPGAQESQPVRVPPVLSLDPSGGVVINVATGDQENLVVNNTERNFVYSIQEGRPTALDVPSKAKVKWYRALGAAERVTGPMTVFDRTLYFATYKPAFPTAPACDAGGTPTLWGMDFFNADPAGISSGGAPRWCPLGQVDAVSGACKAALQANETPSDPTLKGAIIPGVTIQATQSCSQFDSAAGDPSITSLTSTTYNIAFGATNARPGGSPGTGTPTAARASLARPLPRTTATVDAWALVVD
ncbi:MAG: Type fimbrial biosis protein PilY1 [Labilithrix sp.]|nr:Type fimbrial biosis protein PilY1 [Labilithrix sp.]